MTTTVIHLPLTPEAAVLSCVATAARESREPVDIAMERATTARVMAALCEGHPGIGDADTYTQQAAAWAAAVTHLSTERTNQ